MEEFVEASNFGICGKLDSGRKCSGNNLWKHNAHEFVEKLARRRREKNWHFSGVTKGETLQKP